MENHIFEVLALSITYNVREKGSETKASVYVTFPGSSWIFSPPEKEHGEARSSNC